MTAGVQSVDGNAAANPLRRLLLSAFAPVAPGGIVVFRMVYGVLMTSYSVMYMTSGLLEFYYISPDFWFSWPGFSWVCPGSPEIMWTVFAVLAAGGLLAAAGLFYRVVTLALALCFTYVFLCDKTQWQNHYYLMVIMSWIMALIPAHRRFSLDALLFPRLRREAIPKWSLWLLRFQIGVPYFYGGIAKISPDWIAGQPMREDLLSKQWYPIIGPWFSEEPVVQFFVWGGMLFDLLVVPFLLWPRTRTWAYFAALAFHVMNATLFTIGVFPWFMIFATIIFFEPDWPRKLMLWRTSRGPSAIPSADHRHQLGTRRMLIAGLLTVHVLIQILVPFRHYLYPGDVNWTEEGHYFAWHMKLRGKRCAVRYFYVDPNTGAAGTIPFQRWISPRQAGVCAREPRMTVQLAHFLKQQLTNEGHPDFEVRVLNLVSLNGRKPQLLIDPGVDLSAVPLGWGTPRSIVLPLTEPLPREYWNAPVSEWESLVEIPEGVPRMAATGQPARREDG